MSEMKIKDEHPGKNNHRLTFKYFMFLLAKIIKPKMVTLEESVNELIKEHDLQDTINSEEKVMLQNFVDFKDLKAYEVMIPRTFIIGITENATFEELKQKFIEEEHTRIPVFRENLDEIIGFVHMKDFILFVGKEKEFKMEKVLRELIYVPRSMKLVDLLTKMRQARIHIAIVLDEYGGTEGLVTIEDLVEEIVGDIRDEHDDSEEPELVKVEGGTITVDGKARIEEIEEKFKVDLAKDEDDFETFGGFILAYLGKIPAIGEKFDHPSGLRIEIIDADKRKIKKAKVRFKD
ncbi:HlyC/CorC family transporter [Holosporaceae bacterium 'Namur']|nr:HlyC/CorC family transporter [Holosporaceae bacterium 'Namur']